MRVPRQDLAEHRGHRDRHEQALPADRRPSSGGQDPVEGRRRYTRGDRRRALRPGEAGPRDQQDEEHGIHGERRLGPRVVIELVAGHEKGERDRATTPLATSRKWRSHGRSNTTNAMSTDSRPVTRNAGTSTRSRVGDDAVREGDHARTQEQHGDGAARESCFGRDVGRVVRRVPRSGMEPLALTFQRRLQVSLARDVAGDDRHGVVVERRRFDAPPAALAGRERELQLEDLAFAGLQGLSEQLEELGVVGRRVEPRWRTRRRSRRPPTPTAHESASSRRQRSNRRSRRPRAPRATPCTRRCSRRASRATTSHGRAGRTREGAASSRSARPTSA